MCGIAGIIGTENTGALTRMLEATRHRGPDNTGIYHNHTLAIGMNRLSIIDLHVSANQPMLSDDGRYVIVYNGEVYNYRSLRSGLEKRGFTFKTNSDTEVVLTMFIAEKENMLQHIRGMFGFAIWDNETGELFAARDHAGIKPFLYTVANGNFIFCSELKGLLASGLVEREIDIESLNHYFMTGHSISPKTILKQVRSLHMGHYLKYVNGRVEEKAYWKPDTVQLLSTGDVSYNEVVKEVRHKVISSVEEELISDVPLGVFLSGGLDSNVVTAAMKACGKTSIETFSIGFEEAKKKMDESDDARNYASFYNSRHHAIMVTNEEVADIFNDFITGLDHPSTEGLNTYLVSRFARKHVTVALSGLGGDELFCGYIGFKQYLNRKAPVTNKIFKSLLTAFLKSGTGNDQVQNKLLHEAGRNDDSLYYVLQMQRMQNANATRLLHPSLRSDMPIKITSNFIDKEYTFSSIPVNKIRQYYITQYMSNMLLRDSDRVAMRSSLEVRFPLIDYRIIEYAMSIPQEYLIKDITSNANSRNYLKDDLKRILRDAFVDLLPPDLLNKNKSGFQLPFETWMRSSLKDRLEQTINAPCDLINKKEIQKIYNEWRNGKANWKMIWSTFILDSWYKKFISHN